MKTKAIRDLVQLSDGDFFEQVSIGYEKVLKNAIRIDADARLLEEQERPSGCRILSAIAEEEVSKCLILLDAVRCPRQPSDILSQQLGRFNNHLAKGIYAWACYWRPSTLAELSEYVEGECKQFYLDGPNDVDWIFPNRITSEREGAIYVDYARTDQGHFWLSPRHAKSLLPETSEALALAQALCDAGCTTAAALSHIAEFWRSIELTPDLHWSDCWRLNRDTLVLLDKNGLLMEKQEEVYETILDLWTFPMYSIDMKLAEVDMAELRKIQSTWFRELFGT